MVPPRVRASLVVSVFGVNLVCCPTSDCVERPMQGDDWKVEEIIKVKDCVFLRRLYFAVVFLPLL